MALPSPNQLRRKILIKNKRLKLEVEKAELELFWKGEFSIDENEEPKEDSKTPVILKKDENEKLVDSGSLKVKMIVIMIMKMMMIIIMMMMLILQLTADDIPAATPYQASTCNIPPYLSSMVCYCTPLKFQVGFSINF